MSAPIQGAIYVAKMDDNALFSSLRDKLFTAVVGDVLDVMGCGGNSCRRPSGRFDRT